MRKIILIILAAVLVILAGGFFIVTDGLDEGESVQLNGINLIDIPDGSYIGTYDLKRWKNTVAVQISGQKITSINLESDVAATGITNCSEEIFKRVIEAQDTKVDVVAGATVTSKAYLKAIENALAK